MTVIKNDSKCPKCNEKIRVKTYDVISSELRDSFLSKALFDINCKKCGEKIRLDYPFKYKGSYYTLYYKINDYDNENNIERICYTVDEVKEKILIFEEQLDDVLIEFVKLFIKNNLDDKQVNLRFDGVDDDNIVFYNLENKEYVGITKEFYSNLCKNAKFKKIKGAVVIDDATFKKYIKLR